MSEVVIRTEGLGKRYRIGGPQARHRSFREAITAGAAAPFRRLGRTLRGESRSTEETIWALRDVSFEVKRGEAVGVIGRNGAGKSTLLKILSRITEPTEGRVRIKGKVGSLLEVGTGFHHELTGRENIYLSGAILGMKKAEIERRFDEIVAFADIDRFLDTPVKHYSSGMYMRLAFAVAAHLDPDVLLVDEVLAVGDALFQEKCLGRMEAASSQEGRTVIFVSHNMAAVEVLCGSVMLLESGGVADLGAPRQVISAFMQRLMGRLQGGTNAPQSRHIRSVETLDRAGVPTTTFMVGDDIHFEIGLFHLSRIDTPRVSIGIQTESGQRLLTIHTDIQNNRSWAFSGEKTIRARWYGNRMVPGTYRVDVAFWGHSQEIETRRGCLDLTIVPADVYGTAALPDPSFQGYYLPDADWEL